MANQIQISIIVTIHNAEQYLEDCLNSAINQTFSAIEILCMDGGSTDATPEILKKFQQTDSRIRIVNDVNTSYGHKVNRGIEEAKGRYIAVLESDDMYEPDMLAQLYLIAEQHRTDYVNADYRNFFDINGFRFFQKVKMYDKNAYGHVIKNSHWNQLDLFPRYWTGLFRKDFLIHNRIQMNESNGASFQDMSFRFLTAMLAESYYHLKKPVYLYRIDNPGSSMHDMVKTVIIADEHDYLKNELKKRKLDDKNIWFSAYQWKYMDFRGNMRNLSGRYRKELFDRYRKELKFDQSDLDSLAPLVFRTEVQEMISLEPAMLNTKIEEESFAFKIADQKLYDFLNMVTKMAMEHEIILFGCGKNGTRILDLLLPLQNKITCLTDNAEALWNTHLGAYKIISPNETVSKHKDAYFLITVLHGSDEIQKQLHQMGVMDENILVSI